jgi:hypothetical protein
MLAMRHAMYAIRVRPGGEVLEAAFEGRVLTEEALRAVSQGFVLAEAGNISRALVDVTALGGGPEGLMLLAATFGLRVAPGQRVAVLCRPEQLRGARQFARFTGANATLGVFTRPEDAEEWLAGGHSQRLSHTTRRHLAGSEAEPAHHEEERRGVA